MVRTSAGFSQAVSDAVAKARAEGRVRSEAEAKSHADTAAKGQAKQPGGLIGGALGASLTLMLTALAGPALGAASLGVIGLTSSVGSVLGGSVSDNIGTTKSTSQSTTWGDSITESLTETSSRSDTSSITLEYLNKTAEYCERLLDAYVHRLQRAKNLGMWNVGIYFFADDPATFAQGQAQLRSLYSGKETYFEPLRTVDLSPVRASIKLVLSTFSNPVLQLSASVPGAAPTPLPHPLGKLHRGLSTPLHTEELALLMNLPRREVPGLKLEMVADFGVNPRPMNPADQIRIGSVVSGWSRLDIPVAIGRKDLTRHVFVTGITGSGKTNSCFALLKAGARGAGRERAAGPVPFLVIEPAKGEYRGLMAEKEFADLRVYTAGDETISPFRINPFQFVPGTNLVTHLDYLKSIFNASFPMYAAMPYLLEEAVVRLYESKGWDLVRSTNKNLDMGGVVRSWQRGEWDYSYVKYLPTLGELMQMIERVVTGKGYAEEVTRNYAAALKARVQSLVLGSKGCMLDVRQGIPFEELFGQPTVLELRAMGDDDEKCFLMSLLLTQLYEYREQLYRWAPGPGLRHLTVIEEAHRLLGRAGASASMETANTRGKAVETFANMLAEIREYGEGFIIVDQTPAKLIPDVVKNTSTKILHRLTARDDREFVGDTMGMTEDQRKMVPHLRTGHAVVHMEEQDKPIWVQIDPVKGERRPITDEDVRQQRARQQRERGEAALAAVAPLAESLAVDLRRALELFDEPDIVSPPARPAAARGSLTES